MFFIFITLVFNIAGEPFLTVDGSGIKYWFSWLVFAHSSKTIILTKVRKKNQSNQTGEEWRKGKQSVVGGCNDTCQHGG